MAKAPTSIQSLSFVRGRTKKEMQENDLLPRCFWSVQSTGDYMKDGELGSKLALEYLEHEANPSIGPSILPMIIGDMPTEMGPIEINFLTLIGLAAGNGRHYAQRVNAYWAGKTETAIAGLAA